MKIAFVGKGGSGKSSVSWLAVQSLAESGSHVLAIDADHNMDLTSNLGLDPEETPLMHKTDKEFIAVSGLLEDKQWSRIVTDKSIKLPSFSVFPHDTYTDTITTKVSDKVSVINLGLGNADVLYTDKCAHGLSGPLKYYLGLLEEKDSFVVVDSVAGTDMLNFGLYAGIDAVIGVVEPHRNSVKVFEQIYDICRKTMIPCFAIINKPADNEFYTEFREKYSDSILGEVPLDQNILSYSYAATRPETKTAMHDILKKIKGLTRRGNLESMQSFHAIKKSKA